MDRGKAFNMNIREIISLKDVGGKMFELAAELYIAPWYLDGWYKWFYMPNYPTVSPIRSFFCLKCIDSPGVQ